jgi:D-alanine-D-alanine ligase
MDLRPITSDRIINLDPVADSTLVKQLNDLADEVFRELNLEALVRLDLRMDEAGRLVILEANPKPDLRFPDGEATSLVCANLEAYDMNYDDLILSLLADRIDLLFSKRRQSATQLASLLEAS